MEANVDSDLCCSARHWGIISLWFPPTTTKTSTEATNNRNERNNGRTPGTVTQYSRVPAFGNTAIHAVDNRHQWNTTAMLTALSHAYLLQFMYVSFRSQCKWYTLWSRYEFYSVCVSPKVMKFIAVIINVVVYSTLMTSQECSNRYNAALHRWACLMGKIVIEWQWNAVVSLLVFSRCSQARNHGLKPVQSLQYCYTVSTRTLVDFA